MSPPRPGAGALGRTSRAVLKQVRNTANLRERERVWSQSLGFEFQLQGNEFPLFEPLVLHLCKRYPDAHLIL